MDTPRPEEDDVMIAMDPLEVVERVLSKAHVSRSARAPLTSTGGSMVRAQVSPWRTSVS